MGDRFDKLAKDAGGELSRRQAFWRIGGGLLAAAVASLGLTRAGDGCFPSCCASQCRGERAPGEPTPGECMRACLQGIGDQATACADYCK